MDSRQINATMDHLRHYAPFDQMEQEHLMWLAQRLTLVQYDQGEIILSSVQGVAQNLFIIKQGVVKGERKIMIAQHEETALLELNEGECFPLGALRSRRPVNSVYRAREKAVCYRLSANDFLALTHTSAAFNDFCTRRLSYLLEQSRHSIQAHYTQSASEQQSISNQLSTIVKRKPISCAPGTPLRQVLETMDKYGIGSMVAVDEQQRPVGIFTLHDVLSRVTLPGLDLEQPLSAVMTPNPYTMSPHALSGDAALIMAKHGFRHILIAENGQLKGMISEKDLFTLQRIGMHQISGTIRHAENLETLKESARDIQQLSCNMMAQGVAAEQLIRIISTLNDLLTTRIIELELNNSPVKYIDFCWLALGSEGRFEQTMNTEQNNALIFNIKEGTGTNVRQEVILPFAKRVNLALAECGFPLSSDDLMASNPRWCLTLDEWKASFANWIDHSDPYALRYASPFFDFRPQYGAEQLAIELRDWLREEFRNNKRFLRQMAANALHTSPPLGLVRDFVTGHENTLDLKQSGIMPFVDAARTLSLSNGISQTNTVKRLRELSESKIIPRQDADAWIESFLFIQLLRLRLHHQQCEKDMPLTNMTDPDSLNHLDRRILKEAFRQARKLQNKLKLDYQV
jgi:CBS domain-containing protein